MELCRDCKWWEPDTEWREGTGFCRIIGESSRDLGGGEDGAPESLASIEHIEGEWYKGMRLRTAGTFGCIHFSAKE